MVDLQQHPHGVVLPVRATAKARRNAVLGERHGALRVAVSAAPEKGKANRAIAGVLSQALGVATSAIELMSGDASKDKRFLIRGQSLEKIRAALSDHL